jgi:hypothetical protein
MRFSFSLLTLSDGCADRVENGGMKPMSASAERKSVRSVVISRMLVIERKFFVLRPEVREAGE